MATRAKQKAEAPDVVLNHDELRDQYQLGFTLDGTFVPVASVSGGYARALASTTAETADDDDDEKAEG